MPKPKATNNLFEAELMGVRRQLIRAQDLLFQAGHLLAEATQNGQKSSDLNDRIQSWWDQVDPFMPEASAKKSNVG